MIPINNALTQGMKLSENILCLTELKALEKPYKNFELPYSVDHPGIVKHCAVN